MNTEDAKCSCLNTTGTPEQQYIDNPERFLEPFKHNK